MCEAIALKAYSHPLSSYNSGLLSLFNWNNITSLESTPHDKVQGDDNIGLEQYINNEISGLGTINIKVHEELISCHLINKDGLDRTCHFNIDEEQKNVTVKLYDPSSPDVIPILEKSLVLRRKGKDLYVYRQAEFWEVYCPTAYKAYYHYRISTPTWEQVLFDNIILPRMPQHPLRFSNIYHLSSCNLFFSTSGFTCDSWGLCCIIAMI